MEENKADPGAYGDFHQGKKTHNDFCKTKSRLIFPFIAIPAPFWQVLLWEGVCFLELCWKPWIQKLGPFFGTGKENIKLPARKGVFWAQQPS